MQANLIANCLQIQPTLCWTSYFLLKQNRGKWKGLNYQESGHLAWAISCLPLSYDNHNPQSSVYSAQVVAYLIYNVSKLNDLNDPGPT